MLRILDGVQQLVRTHMWPLQLTSSLPPLCPHLQQHIATPPHAEQWHAPKPEPPRSIVVSSCDCITGGCQAASPSSKSSSFEIGIGSGVKHQPPASMGHCSQDCARLQSLLARSIGLCIGTVHAEFYLSSAMPPVPGQDAPYMGLSLSIKPAEDFRHQAG